MKCKYSCCQNEVDNSLSSKKIFCSYGCKDKYFVDKRRWELKFKAIEYKGGCCQECGYRKCPAALEFHHIDPKIKSFSISSGKTRSWDKIKIELDKCILLCSNCHKEEEFKLKSEHKDFLNALVTQMS